MMNETVAGKPLRLWPGVALALIVVAALVPFMTQLLGFEAMFVALGGAVLILLWWLLFSRARWYERVGAVVLIAAADIAQKYVVHPSIAGAGMGYLSYPLQIPTLCIALVAWAWISRRLSPGPRLVAAFAAAVLGCVPWTLTRTGGVTGTGMADFHWRWSMTPEERLLARAADEPTPPVVAAPAPAPAAIIKPADAAAPAAEPAAPPPIVKSRPAEWPGFRGPNRNDVVHGITIAADWSQTPPTEIWRKPIGPGWSSFAVNGDLIYTQEQRGGDEVVSCYRLSTGAVVWRHRDATRFWESNGGAGPRGTPSVVNGRVYTLGATGVLNSLDAITGAVMWSRNAASDIHVKIPTWGIASSPLVLDDVVVVAAAGKLGAYDLTTGHPRWSGAGGGVSYSSPHLATIDGVQQVVFLGGPGAVSVDPATGKVLWQHAWEGGAIVQPAITPEGDVLVSAISMNGGEGLRRLAVTQTRGVWTAQEKWTSKGLKPYFNDFVIHKGHAYGFDNSILSCIDLADGSRAWKGGRYGNGQLVLLADQDLLLVISEEGELALVNATPDQFKEVARAPALEGKTWNHPVLVGGVLLVRNDHEMAAFKMPAAGR